MYRANRITRIIGSIFDAVVRLLKAFKPQPTPFYEDYPEAIVNKARIHAYKNGTFALVRLEDNLVVGKYKRRRDAVRGADRKGLEIV